MAGPRILTLTLICAAASAWAGPGTDPSVGRAVFTGATMPHATSLSLDPAALGLGSVDQIYVAATGVIDQLRADLQTLDGNALVPGPRVRDTEVAPGGMIAFIGHLAGDTLTVGIEARTLPRETFPSDQAALKYVVTGGGERDWLVSAGLSYKLTGDIYVGTSLSHQNTFLRLHYARDSALDSSAGPSGVMCGGAPCGIGNPEAAQLWDINVHSPLLSASNLRVNVGALVQIVRDVWLGVGYHTPPGFAVQSELVGQANIDRAPRDVASGGTTHISGPSLVEIQFPASVDAELRARLPAGLDLHVGGRWEDLSRLQAYDVRTFGTELGSNDIPEWSERPRGLHDAFAGWIGVEQVDVGQPYLFGARGGFETSAVSASRTSGLTVSPASLTLDLGAQLRLGSALSAQFSYGLQYFPEVTVTDSEFDPRLRVACDASGFDYSTPACAAVRDGYAVATGAGSYTKIEHAIRIGLRYELR